MSSFKIGRSKPSVTSFRRGEEPRATDVFIAVMGVTGAGKSTLISLCTKTKVKIGHDLEACTQEVDVYVCRYSSSTSVFLIDTPGFDDTNRSDSDVLREIASWLTASYSKEIKLNGIIYLHRISDVRMQGSAKKNLFMFKKLCGPEAMKNVILATTMWSKVSEADGDKREKQLIQEPEFWGKMVENGSKVFRHTNDRASAMKLVEYLLSRSGVTLEIQEEMVNKKITLDKTSAGKQVESNLAEERKKFEKQLRELEKDMKEAQKQRDRESEKELDELRRKNAEDMKRIELDRKNLKATMEKLHEERYAKLERQFKKQQDDYARQTAKQDAEIEKLRQEHQAAQKKIQEQEAAKRQTQAIQLAERPKPVQSMPVYQASTSSYYNNQTKNKRNWVLYGDVKVSISDNYFLLSAYRTSRLKIPDSWWAFNCTDRDIEFLAFGVGPSAIFKYRSHNGYPGSFVDRRGPVHEHYPLLWEHICLRRNEAWGELQYISLGPNGTHFVRWENGALYKVPTSLSTGGVNVDRDHQSIKFIALGAQGAYYVRYLDGRRAYWVPGYTGLREKIEEWEAKGTRVKSIALDLVYGNYIVIAEDGNSYWVGPLADQHKFLEFAQENFGSAY